MYAGLGRTTARSRYSISPREMVMSFWRNRSLIWQMTRRDVIGRYRGSVMGIVWSFFHPILMLGVYTFVFSVVFKTRWVGGDSTKAGFAIMLFVGLIIHGLFSECVSRAPVLVLNNVNYVKKVVFPLEILAWVGMASALFHASVSTAVLVIFYAAVNASLHWTIVFFPLVLAPFILLIMGLSWFLAATGVFLRDITQTMGIITTVLLFLSPVFYPATALPEAYQAVFNVNPLTFMIEQARDVLINGKLPDWVGLTVYSLVSISTAWAGFAWFQRTRNGFADVV